MKESKCGLLYDEDGVLTCFQTKKPVQASCTPTCSYFIEQQFDGDEPYTPAEHLLLGEDWRARKGMKSIQGMRF